MTILTEIKFSESDKGYIDTDTFKKISNSMYGKSVMPKQPTAEELYEALMRYFLGVHPCELGETFNRMEIARKIEDTYDQLKETYKE